jgi:anti-anti-sigma factor
MRHLKMFNVETAGDIVILQPRGEGGGFRYQDLHSEVSSVRTFLLKPGHKHLVVDLGQMDYFGSEFVGALISMLRETKTRGGKACFCGAMPQMLDVLANMSLTKLWPHYDTREEALAEVQKA